MIDWKPYHPAVYRAKYSSAPFAWPEPPPAQRVPVTLRSFSAGGWSAKNKETMTAHLTPAKFRKFEIFGEGGHKRHLVQQQLIADACDLESAGKSEQARALLLDAGELQVFDGYEVEIKAQSGGTKMRYQVIHPLNFNEHGYYGGTAYETNLYYRYDNVFWPEPLRIPETYQDPIFMRVGEDGIVWQMPYEAHRD